MYASSKDDHSTIHHYINVYNISGRKIRSIDISNSDMMDNKIDMRMYIETVCIDGKVYIVTDTCKIYTIGDNEIVLYNDSIRSKSPAKLHIVNNRIAFTDLSYNVFIVK